MPGDRQNQHIGIVKLTGLIVCLAERIAASYDLLAQDGDPAASESY